MNKYTSGPWRLLTGKPDGDNGWTGIYKHDAKDDAWELLADAAAPEDARLISQSPDMADLLTELVEAYKDQPAILIMKGSPAYVRIEKILKSIKGEA